MPVPVEKDVLMLNLTKGNKVRLKREYDASGRAVFVYSGDSPWRWEVWQAGPEGNPMGWIASFEIRQNGERHARVTSRLQGSAQPALTQVRQRVEKYTKMMVKALSGG